MGTVLVAHARHDGVAASSWFWNAANYRKTWVGGVGRATQGLMILSVMGGPIVGTVILWCVDESGLNPQLISRTKWLARLAVVLPLLTLLVMFFIAGIT